MQTKVDIIQAQTHQDLDLAGALFKEYAASLDFDLDFQDFNEELHNLPGEYAPPEGRILIGLHSGRPAGCIALRKFSEGICEMKRLYVRPQFRRLGIGRALSEAIIDEARKIGYSLMRLDTVPSMRAARILYESLGFEAISPYRHNPIEGAVFMELALR
jgi:ribosomal protein S18 acetylase RimI-like enzyme